MSVSCHSVSPRETGNLGVITILSGVGSDLIYSDGVGEHAYSVYSTVLWIDSPP